MKSHKTRSLIDCEKKGLLSQRKFQEFVFNGNIKGILLIYEEFMIN